MSALLYADLYKPIKKVISDGYNPDKGSFTTKTKHADDLELEFNIENKGASTDGKLSWKQIFKHEKQKYTVNGKVDVSGTVNTSVEAEGLATGLKLKASADLYAQPGKTTDTGAFNIEYKQENFTVASEFKKSVGKPLGLTLSATAGYKGFNAGLSTKFVANVEEKKDAKKDEKKEEKKETEEKKPETSTPAATATTPAAETKTGPATLTQYDVSLRYDYDNLTVVGALEESAKKVKIGALAAVRKDLSVAAEFITLIKSEEKKEETATSAPATTPAPATEKTEKTEKKTKITTESTLTVGVQKKIDDNTSVQIKADTKKVVSVAYTVKIQKELEAVISAEATLGNLNSNSKVGVAFTYSPSDKI